MKKIGIMGGSFDPVHYGHIYLARQAKEEVGLDKVLFMPVKLQPFKMNKKLTDSYFRVKMLELAIEGMEGFEISKAEIERDEISYTIDTLNEMKEYYGDESKIYFILGTDSFIMANKWKNSEKLLSEYSFILGTRPGYKESELQGCIEYNQKKYNTDIRRISNPQLLLSSTEIRKKIKNGEKLDNLLPKAVERYIKDNGLYKGTH